VEIENTVIFANHVGLIGRYDHHYQQPGIPIRLAVARIRDKDYNWKGLDEKKSLKMMSVGYGSIILSG